MSDKSFYGLLMVIFGVLGFICAVLTCTLLWINTIHNIKFGNMPYLYFSVITIICFVSNSYLSKKQDRTVLSRIGHFLSILSLLPICLFFVMVILALIAMPFLMSFSPTKLQ